MRMKVKAQVKKMWTKVQAVSYWLLDFVKIVIISVYERKAWTWWYLCWPSGTNTRSITPTRSGVENISLDEAKQSKLHIGRCEHRAKSLLTEFVLKPIPSMSYFVFLVSLSSPLLLPFILSHMAFSFSSLPPLLTRHWHICCPLVSHHSKRKSQIRPGWPLGIISHPSPPTFSCTPAIHRVVVSLIGVLTGAFELQMFCSVIGPVTD